MPEEPLFVSDADEAESADRGLKRARRRRQRTNEQRLGFVYASEEEEGLSSKSAAYDHRLRDLRKALAKVGLDAKKLIPQTAITGQVFGHLVRSAMATTNPPTKRKRRIYLVGDSGAGKSSTINCILGMPNLAMAFGLGESVTRVATSYEAAFAWQTRRFAARIVCLSLNEIRAKLRGLYRDYRSYQLELADMNKKAQAKAARTVAVEDDDDVALEDDATFDARNAKRQASQSAFEVFRSLFCEQREFSDAERAEAFLQQAGNDTEEKLINVFTSWCQALLPKNTEAPQNKKRARTGDQIPVLQFEADTQDELQAQLNLYVASNEASSTASLWALVSKIHIGICDVPILQHALFVDWPGAGDTNDLRAKASTQRVSDCDEIWIVCHISRVCTNKTVSDALHRYAAAKPCAIVCTHLDANADDPEGLKQLEARGFLDVRYTEQLKSRDSLESALRSLQEELTECKEAILDGHILDDDGFMRKGTAEQLQMARDEINSDEIELLKLKSKKADADTSIVNLGWDLQKPYYREKLDTMLRELGLTADVFFVSNEHYMGCKGAKPVKGGLLELARTGIPDLRRHVLGITAVDEMATLQEYIANVETFLKGVSVVVNPEHLKQNREVLLTIERAKGRVSDLKHQEYFAALDEAIEENLERSIRRRMDTLATKAAELAHEKLTWHPSTLKAFISHAGRWKTKKVGSQDWNRAFFAKFVKIILANWDAFETAEANAFTSLQTALSREIRGVIADANKRGAEKRLGDKTGEFRALIEAKIEAADRLCEKAKREYAIKLG